MKFSFPEEDERDLATPVVPVIDPADDVKSSGVEEKTKPDSSSSPSSLSDKEEDDDEEEEDEEEEEEENEDSQNNKDQPFQNVQRSATVIHVKEPEKDEEESSEEESSEEESSEEESDKLKRCPTQVIRPPGQVAASEKKKEESESEEESSEEESSSDETDDKKIDNEQKVSTPSKKQEENKTTPTSGESYWPKLQKKDSLPTQDNLTLFIGQCKDIDEMLGVPSPVSPGSAKIANSSSSSKQQPFSFQSNDVAKQKGIKNFDIQ
ncbi:RNase H domain-containing protein [Caerostris extrusa]|uniref:RNase H domain-containing protein n=1 Tax=Caerostris extrusa TaxID=172846 RepID=A0AAV4PXT1_CAEEX|nr:RNase H domain-containing protein [Caerostris extrusa]